MEIGKPSLFLELDDEKFILAVAQYDNELNYKILDSIEVKSVGILNGKIIDIESSSNILKDTITSIEKKINYNFKNIVLISNQKNFECINISGFKKLAGSQIITEDISYILNNIKKVISDNNPGKSLIHIFNSNFILDGTILKKLPTGLHGQFYNQHLTFFLFPKHEIKNMQLTLKNCNLNIERIIFSEFVLGIKKLNTKELSVLINFKKEKITISVFENSSLIFSEHFEFGSNIILRDISKVCSLSLEIVKQIFSNNFFKKEQNKEEYLEKKYFEEGRFRSISKTHLKDIVIARLEEIIEKIYKKNINLTYLKHKKKNVHILLEDLDIFNNLSEYIENKIKNSLDTVFLNSISTQDERLVPVLSSIELIAKGWEKEAIPVVQANKSIISRIFSLFFK